MRVFRNLDIDNLNGDFLGNRKAAVDWRDLGQNSSDVPANLLWSAGAVDADDDSNPTKGGRPGFGATRSDRADEQTVLKHVKNIEKGKAPIKPMLERGLTPRGLKREAHYVNLLVSGQLDGEAVPTMSA